jgi:hypothetical protein
MDFPQIEFQEAVDLILAEVGETVDTLVENKGYNTCRDRNSDEDFYAACISFLKQKGKYVYKLAPTTEVEEVQSLVNTFAYFR